MPALTTEQIGRYRADGFVALPALLQGEKLQGYVRLFEGLVERARAMGAGGDHFAMERGPDGAPRPGVLHKVQGVAVVEPRVLDLAREPEVLDPVRSLIGPDLDVFGTKFFPKLPRVGTSTIWHQDNGYFDTNTDRIVTCGIYLQDADPANGCLRLVPGSHRDATIARHYRVPGRMGLTIDVDESKAVDLACPAGTVVLFSANLYHGANDNRSERSRYSLAWHYLPTDLHLERFPHGVYEDRHTVS